jgi:hypothetical protein
MIVWVLMVVVTAFVAGLQIGIGVGMANEQLNQLKAQQYKQSKQSRDNEFFKNFMSGMWR